MNCLSPAFSSHLSILKNWNKRKENYINVEKMEMIARNRTQCERRNFEREVLLTEFGHNLREATASFCFKQPAPWILNFILIFNICESLEIQQFRNTRNYVITGL